MRYLAALFAAFVVAACSTVPVERSASQTVSPSQVPVPALQTAQMDSVAQFLLTAAATDFHAHGPSHPVGGIYSI